MSGLQAPAPGVYRRHRPETTALYEVVRDNLRAEPVARPDEERAAAPKATAARSSREAVRRRIVVETNVRGRDVASFVAEARKRLAREVQLPSGYFFRRPQAPA